MARFGWSLMVIFLWTIHTKVAHGNLEDLTYEQAENTLNVTFYLMTESKWTEVESAFQESVATGLTEYCADNFDACGFNSWSNSYAFTASDVVIALVEPLRNRLNVTYYVIYNSGVPSSSINESGTVVNMASVTEAFELSRAAVATAVGADVIGVGDIEHTPVPPAMLNLIIIPVACGLLLFLIVLTIGLFYYRANKDKSEAKQKKKALDKERRELKRSSKAQQGSRPVSKVGPSPTDKDKNNGRNKHFKREDSDSYHGNHTEETVINMSNDASRPPVDNHSSDRHREHKKHKKHRRHHRRQRSRSHSDDESEQPRRHNRKEKDNRDNIPSWEKKSDEMNIPATGPNTTTFSFAAPPAHVNFDSSTKLDSDSDNRPQTRMY